MRWRILLAAILAWLVAVGLFVAAALVASHIPAFQAFAQGKTYRVDIRVQVWPEFQPGAIVLPEVFDSDTRAITASVGLWPGDVRTFMSIPYVQEVKAGSAMIALRNTSPSTAVPAEKKRVVLDALYAKHADLRVVPRATYDQIDSGGETTSGTHIVHIVAGRWTIGLRLAGWLMVGTAAMLSVWALAGEIRRRGRKSRGCCTICGYSLQGLGSDGLCPECGASFEGLCETHDPASG